MRGRKPNEIAAGTAPVAFVPKPPAWLSKDAKAEWRRVAAILVERRHLTEADLGVLATCCDAYGTVCEMSRLISREGPIILNAKGEMKRNPATGIKNEAVTRHRQLCAELGLTPVSRSRPSIRDDNADDLSFMD